EHLSERFPGSGRFVGCRPGGIQGGKQWKWNCSEHYQRESDLRSGGDFGDGYRNKFRSDWHSNVQRRNGNADELEWGEHYGAGTKRSDDGECGGHGWWGRE